MLIQNQSMPQDIRVLHESLALISNGYTVSAICPARKGQPWREVIQGILVYRFPSIQFNNSFPIKDGLLRYLVEYGWSVIAMFLLSFIVFFQPGFNIIHAGNPPDILVPIFAFYKIFGKQIVFDQHDLSPELYNAKYSGAGKHTLYSILVWFEMLSCKLADLVITSNQSQKNVVSKRHHIREDKITIVRNGPITSFAAEKPIPEMKHDGKSLIVYAGVIGLQDGVDHLIRAIHCLVFQVHRNDFECVIVGDGDAYSSVTSLSEELKLTSYIKFTGWIEYPIVRRYLRTADICVVPEPSNPLNDCSTVVKMMEYMASAKPIVAFDLPEHRVTVQNGAVFAHPNDDQDFALQIATLMDDSDKRRTMGQVNLERLEKELLWCHQSEFLVNAYQKMYHF